MYPVRRRHIPAYARAQPAPQERREAQPSAASLADSTYQYPDPSPANSPSSGVLNSTATVMSEAVVAAAIGDTVNVDKGGMGGRLGNGEASLVGKVGVGGPGGSLGMGESGNRAVAGVQTTPSVNGSLEINQLRAELALKNQQLEQMGMKLVEYKDSLLKVTQAFGALGAVCSFERVLPVWRRVRGECECRDLSAAGRDTGRVVSHQDLTIRCTGESGRARHWCRGDMSCKAVCPVCRQCVVVGIDQEAIPVTAHVTSVLTGELVCMVAAHHNPQPSVHRCSLALLDALLDAPRCLRVSSDHSDAVSSFHGPTTPHGCRCIREDISSGFIS